MLFFLLYISNILTQNNCYTHGSSTNNASSYSGGNDGPLVIYLKDGSVYEFDKANIVKVTDGRNGFVLHLDDGSRLNVSDNNVSVRPSPNQDYSVNNVQKVREQGDNLILDLKNGDTMLVNSPAGYVDNGNGSVDIKTNENTELTTEPNNEKGNVEDDGEDEEDEDDDDSSSSSALTSVYATFLIGFVSLCMAM
ncbi:putative SP-containing protein [Vairimorpha necatrix]|uniref:SP-containing protein n=1 Tax=Vairimorpha necatrix TaxID=6039 RepID=A0AAX4J9C5_9MICR